jgi:hypothetical protein
MNSQPIKITNLETLKLEKQRLSVYCDYQEERIVDKFKSIKSNYKQIIGEEFLPFNLESNRKISGIMDWINDLVFTKVLKIDLDDKNKLSGSLIKLAEVGVVRLFNNFIKKKE